MPLLGNLFKKGINLRSRLKMPETSPLHQQKLVLKKLLLKARDTQFGNHYRFDIVLKSFNIFKAFSENVPLHDYNKIHDEWWYKSQQGLSDVTWPGSVKYFALSSGTSDASSKYIPVTADMIRAIRKASIKQLYALLYYDLPSELFEKGILMLGGSTHLNYNGTYFCGDLSGINASRIPFWFQHFYKPGKKISKTSDWNEKLDEIVRRAPEWDIWIICGVPAWNQIMIEKIVEHYSLKSIHDIWPNLRVFTWGGVSIEPYKKSFEKLLDSPLIYLETYLASEGFIAYDSRPDGKGMKLILNNGIYYEFAPFTSDNFEADGTIKPDATVVNIGLVEENVDYAILLSTCSGAWRYLIGDVVRFVDKVHSEIKIVGRTKHYISLCGEHLSVDNMHQALYVLQDKLDVEVPEFAVLGENFENLFAHRWYLGSDKPIDPEVAKQIIDETLCKVNDDYKVERIAALKDVFVEVYPLSYMYEWMEQQGKMGGQNKFPRVLNKVQAKSWKEFLEAKSKTLIS